MTEEKTRKMRQQGKDLERADTRDQTMMNGSPRSAAWGREREEAVQHPLQLASVNSNANSPAPMSASYLSERIPLGSNASTQGGYLVAEKLADQRPPNRDWSSDSACGYENPPVLSPEDVPLRHLAGVLHQESPSANEREVISADDCQNACVQASSRFCCFDRNCFNGSRGENADGVTL